MRTVLVFNMKGSDFMKSIDNCFVLYDTFGDDFNFIGSEIDCVRSETFAGRLSMDIITDHDVKKPSPRWKGWEKVSVTLDFFGVREMHTKVVSGKFIVKEFTVESDKNAYIMKIVSENGDFIVAVFGTKGLVQNIKPISMTEEDDVTDN